MVLSHSSRTRAICSQLARHVEQWIELRVLALDAVGKQCEELLRFVTERDRIGAEFGFRPLFPNDSTAGLTPPISVANLFAVPRQIYCG
jgi:hypothetical protein